MKKDKMIYISRELHAKLWNMRRPSETFEDVIWRLLKNATDKR